VIYVLPVRENDAPEVLWKFTTEKNMFGGLFVQTAGGERRPKWFAII